jgi:hypothetical protein
MESLSPAALKKLPPHAGRYHDGCGKETVFSRKSTAVDEVISKPFTLAEIDETIQSLSGKALWA